MNTLEPYIPYLGNKFGIVDALFSAIRSLDIPSCKVIKCPFCGGGAFEYYLAQHGFTVEASDIDESLILLHNACKDDPDVIELLGGIPYTKEEFMAIRDMDGLKPALARSLWSFGNDCRTYLCAKEKEHQKIEDFKTGNAEPNSRFVHVEDICLLWSRKPEMKISFTCQSYENVTVGKNEMAYCDPPYRGTKGYRTGDFDHEAFYRWALAQEGLVLISEYDMPEPFVLLERIPKWVETSRGARNKMAEERLYANKPVKKLTLF